MPGLLPLGPLRKTASNSDTDEVKDLVGWYAKAWAVWHSLLATTHGAANHKFRLEASAGRTAHREMGASITSALLRSMTRNSKDAITLMRKGALGSDHRVKANFVSNTRACNRGKELKAADVNLTAVRTWCTQVDSALKQRDFDKAAQLVRTLDKEACNLEDNDNKEGQQQW